MKTENEKRFDQSAQTWDENPAHAKRAETIAAAIRHAVSVTSDSRIMDYGCGTGLIALALQPYAKAIVGVDSSAAMLEIMNQKIASANLSNVTTWHGDLAVEDFGDERFTLVVSSMALHHVKDPATLIRKLAEVVTPGGAVCIADLDAEDGSFHADKTGVEHFGFSETQMHRMFAQAGLVNVSSSIAYRICRPSAEGDSREYPVLLTVGKKTS